MSDLGTISQRPSVDGQAENRPVIDVRNFAASAGGETTDTVQLQAAIDTAGRAGGGTVRVAPGVYRVGTIQLRSGIVLQLDRGATLLGLERLTDYPPPSAGFVDAVGQPRGRCLIYAHGLTDVAIQGEGTIDGRGSSFVGENYAGRPFLIRFVECHRVRLQGITLRDAGAWVCHLEACNHVLVDGVTIRSRANHNNDGIDVDSCSDVIIRDCDISTGDDAICLKATRTKPCERVTVERCRLSSACGAIKLGTESYGDFRDVIIRECQVYDTGLCAIKIISTDGAVIERVRISDIDISQTTGPIFIRLGDRCRTYGQDSAAKTAGRIADVTIERIRATVSVPAEPVLNPWTQSPEPPAAFSGILFIGLPTRPLENLCVRDVEIKFVGGHETNSAESRFDQPSTAYPEHFYFGVLSAWAICARHVSGLRFDGVRLTRQLHDARPAFVCENVARLEKQDWDEAE